LNNGETLTRNFMVSELACPCCGQCEMSPVFMDRLQVLRDLYAKPITVVSGYRCSKHNSEVRGSPKSDHLRGEAADLRVNGITSGELYRLRELAFKLEFNGVGFGRNQFHLGIRPGEGNHGPIELSLGMRLWDYADFVTCYYHEFIKPSRNSLSGHFFDRFCHFLCTFWWQLYFKCRARF